MSARIYGVLLLSFSRHSHQRNFVPLYRAHPRVRIVAVADDDDAIDADLRDLNRRWAAKLEVPYISCVAAALGRADVDVVSIAHDIERRASLARTAAAAGKHLWIDKFTGATVDECDAVAAAVAEAGVTAVVPSYHYGALARQARAALTAGDLGELLGVHVDILFAKGWPRLIAAGDRHPFVGPEGGWKHPEFKRELLTVGAYGVGLLQTCLAPVRYVAGYAGAFFFPEHARAGAEDFGTLTVCDAEGRLGTVCGGRIGVGSHPAGGPATARLVGSGATLTLEAKRPALRAWVRATAGDLLQSPAPEDPMQWASGPPATELAVDDDVTGLAAALDDLVAALDTGRPPRCDAARARDLMEILLAGYAAVESGRVVDLPLPRATP